jgi:hypothetical protein
MKVVIPVTCAQCNERGEIAGVAGQQLPNYHCSCGVVIWGVDEVPLVHAVVSRANSELEKHSDYPLSIVFSAMAVDCQLAQLYTKWAQIEAGLRDQSLSTNDIDAKLRRWRIADKLDEIPKFLVGMGWDSFVESRTELRSWVTKEVGVPGSLSSAIQNGVFRVRNVILHFGKTDQSKDDATNALKMAGAGIHVLLLMDHERRKRLESHFDALRKERKQQ